ncbi:2-polyprenyl-6-methoxyphenol hydroxylase-like FAD-dependent oxidoreductase [Thermocatellispora tengchongensis]|uniref:2-polyprenyl-6-methoxyphenol hydroxylase-like FAD-dependent oxidoreductase n=1 Tax=Thermocatellispora tengchongensis TaxID=1073253 RepID=A0A840PKJ4_9ACTN|nr:FAD-dependent monooxygenase [Thermocatellispora tengchongensis]MBB5136575.1 2-polyprenyl-6-methoxyphenol hydroxylase-like FAD-dependent oxidoreductase [Thermocatellispora tengchongensis]
MGHAVVIGGGIGGLTAAVALRRRGWTVTVCERAPSLDPVGSGLAVAANALKALDEIGAGEAVRKLSAIRGDGGIRRADGRWLSRTSEAAAAARYGGDSVVLLLRATLVNLLAERLDGAELLLGTAAELVDAETGAVRVGDREIQADLVVAVDGIRSAVRRALFPAHPAPEYAGVTAWRFVAPRPDVPFGTTESWGAGLVFGVMPLVDDLVYCYATDAVPEGGAAPGGDEKAELARLFGGWHAPIPQAIALADPATVMRHDIYSLNEPLPTLHRGRVALLGDAAHAMTPNLGQGACQAIEDAVVLAGLADRPGGLAAYTAARLPRTTAIVRRSRRICRLTRMRNPLAVRLRDSVMALGNRYGGQAMLRQMDDVLGWRPPRL